MKRRAFRGDETPAEEKAEARAVKKGAVTPSQYAKKEKEEGEKTPTKTLKARGEKLKSGALPEESYAAKNCGGKVKKMASGGKVKRMAVGGRAGNAPSMIRPSLSREEAMALRPARPAVAADTARPMPGVAAEPGSMPPGARLGAGLARAQAQANMPMVNRPPVGNAPANVVPNAPRANPMAPAGFKKGGKIDGAAVRGKTKGRIK